MRYSCLSLIVKEPIEIRIFFRLNCINIFCFHCFIDNSPLRRTFQDSSVSFFQHNVALKLRHEVQSHNDPVLITAVLPVNIMYELSSQEAKMQQKPAMVNHQRVLLTPCTHCFISSSTSSSIFILLYLILSLFLSVHPLAHTSFHLPIIPSHAQITHPPELHPSIHPSIRPPSTHPYLHTYIVLTRARILLTQVCGQLSANQIATTLQTLVLLNPSPNRMISAIMAESGTTIEIGRNMLFRLSGSSVRPA